MTPPPSRVLLILGLAWLTGVGGCDCFGESPGNETTAPARPASDSPLDTVDDDQKREVVLHYAILAEAAYRDSAEAAEVLLDEIRALLDAPSDDTLAAARGAWVETRQPYGYAAVFQTEDAPSLRRELRTRIGGWPVAPSDLEAQTDDNVGLIDDSDRELTRDALIDAAASGGGGRIVTGFHTIEFLLWGRDSNDHGPGDRPPSAFDTGADASDAKLDRRRRLLRELVELLVVDLHRLADAWSTDDGSYRTAFLARDRSTALAQILAGAIDLNRHIADIRLGRLLDADPDRWTVSRFADNTHRDLVANTHALLGIYNGRYRRPDDTTLDGPGLGEIVAELAPDLDARCTRQLDTTADAIRALPRPLDRAADTEAGRGAIRHAIRELERQADIFEAIRRELEL